MPKNLSMSKISSVRIRGCGVLVMSIIWINQHSTGYDKEGSLQRMGKAGAIGTG